MKYWFLSLFLSYSLDLCAQPVDLLQQLYGKPSAASGTGSGNGNEVPGSAQAPHRPSSSSDIPPLVSETVTLTLRDSFTVARERMFLSDLASCRGSKKFCDELQGVDLGAAPKPMRQDRIARQQVEATVQKEFSAATVVWDGADHCLVTALSSPVNEESVVRVLEHEFQAAPKGMRVVVQSIRLPSMQVLRHNNYSYRIASYGDQISRVFSNPRSRFAQVKILAVDLDPSSQATVEFVAQVNLRVEIQALVVIQAKERGERLTAESIELQWIAYQDQVVMDDKLLVGKLLRSRIMANQAIRSWDLTREPEVQRGDRIEAVINSNGIKLNSVAQALEPGFIGQKIRIRLEATKKNILAVVIARSQVEVPSL
ncbi:MAG: flagellar basal body P-ring formation protein FlgA [Oligoflexus sp.]|nr:flagellar basal body P-ring formation protein FlgA [Oligoflexus sp.]